MIVKTMHADLQQIKSECLGLLKKKLSNSIKSNVTREKL